MRTLARMVFASLTLTLIAASAAAQEVPEGVNAGNYNIKQVWDVGGRITDKSGNGDVFRTYANLNSGPRIFEFTTEMRSLDHQGFLFDDLFLSNFGYGGDPNNISRLRVYKNRWYNFSATFRRDRNFWDYNLLANPINPNVAVANAPAGFSPIVLSSPHRQELVRRMTDYSLTLMPQSRVRFRMAYSRNISEGPSFTSFHEGTDVLLFQDWKTTLNSYQIGADFRLLPRTSISFDQFFHYYKGDTSWEERNQNLQLTTGTPVDIGIPINTAAGQPCATPFNATPAGTVNPACNGYLVYQAVSPVRTSYPTSRLNLQSTYFRNIDFSARFAYSSSDSDQTPFNEFFQGLVTRTRQREFNISGPSAIKRVVVTTDFGVTVHVTEHFRVQDSFHFQNFRIPGQFALTETSLFGTSMTVAPNVFTPGAAPPASCPTITSAGCPQHSSSSPADVISGLSDLFFGENSKTNQFQLSYDFSSRFGVRGGHRFRTRQIVHRETETEDLLFFPTLPNRGACAGQPLLPDNSCAVTTFSATSEQFDFMENSFLLGLWALPTDPLRFSFDMEIMSADGSFTRITPRDMQRFKIRGSYKPVNWASVAGSINLENVRNDVIEINHKRHNRSYGFNVILSPEDTWSVDFGYDYEDIASATNICYTLGSVPPPPGSSPCPTSSLPLSGISLYTNKAHFGHVDFMFRPHRRVTANVGYSGISTDGSTTFLSPNPPAGPLSINYHQPSGQVIVDLSKGFAWRFGWNYYEYREKALPDPTGLRNFQSNMFTLSLRYSR